MADPMRYELLTELANQAERRACILAAAAYSDRAAELNALGLDVAREAAEHFTIVAGLRAAARRAPYGPNEGAPADATQGN